MSSLGLRRRIQGDNAPECEFYDLFAFTLIIWRPIIPSKIGGSRDECWLPELDAEQRHYAKVSFQALARNPWKIFVDFSGAFGRNIRAANKLANLGPAARDFEARLN